MTSGKTKSTFGNHFVWGASQINTDLAQVAQCEYEDDITVDGIDSACIFNITRSAEFWKLRQQFVNDASRGCNHSLLYLVWRAYNAGRLSPDRLIPRTLAERREDRIEMRTLHLAAKEEGRRRQQERQQIQ